MKTLLAFVFVFASQAFALETLEFAGGTLKADVTWVQGPRMPDVSELKIEWKSGSNEERVEAPGPWNVVLWMPMHGHGSSPVSLTKLGHEPGVWQVTDLYFTMPGDWEVRVILKYANGSEESRNIPVKIPARRR